MARPLGARLAALARDVARANRAFLIVAAAFVGGTLLVRGGDALAGLSGMGFWLARALVIALYFAVGALIVERLRGRDEPARLGYGNAWRKLRAGDLSNRRLASACVVLLAVPIVIATYTGWKVRMPVTHPFAWDATFARWDLLLHGGRQPWEWLQPLLGHPAVTRAIDRGYTLVWGSALAVAVVWRAFGGPSAARTTFLVAFTLSWPLIGIVAAYAMSSAGPCYFARVGAAAPGADPFAPLMQYLHGLDLQAVRLQELLWGIYAGQHAGIVGSGISAMPSMHIATSTIVMLSMWRTRARWLGVAFVAFMLVGSVHLGWHYALDGYVGIAMAVVLWHLVAWVSFQAQRRRRGVEESQSSRARG